MFTTLKSRENNPKAVFVGDQTPLITEVAQYLNERDVELFSGKNLADAFFGDYFFYVGHEQDVKSFLETNSDRLPKSLFILPTVSVELKRIFENKNLNQLKIILINKNLSPNKEVIEQIINFFFADQNTILNLTSLMPIEAEKAVTTLISTTVKPLQEENKNSEFEIKTKPKTDIREKTSENKYETAGSKTDLPQTQVEKDIQNLFKKSPAVLKQNSKSSPTKMNIISNIFSKFFTTILILFFVFIIFFCFETIITFIVLAGFKTTNMANLSWEKNKTTIIKFTSTNALNNWRLTMPLWEMIKQKELANEIDGVLDITKHAANISDLTVDVAMDATKVSKQVLTGENQTNLNEKLSSLRTNITAIDTELAAIEARSKSTPILNFCQNSALNLRSFCNSQFENISSLRQFSIKAKQFFPLLPDVIGLNGPRKYLIVLQNNMELRPTGGFIGAFALVSFDQGVLKNVEVSDVYSADGQLKGHIDPPLPIRTYLGQEHWYMRDANWDPDFSATGQQLAWFLDKEINVSVDGVWAVDLTLAKSMIEAIGEINLPDFQTKITADNLFTKTHENTNQDFFPGSTQKKDFLGSLFKSILEKITSQKNISDVKIGEAIFQSFQQKHLQIFFTTTAFENVMKDIGWAGELKNQTCENECKADFLSTNDANLGINKANYYVEKSLEDKIFFQDNVIQHSLVINYKNNSPVNEDGIGGTYKNYLRIYVPGDSQVVEASINNQLLKLSTDQVATKSAVIQQMSNKLTSIGVLLEVKPESETSFNVVYTQPLKSDAGLFNYQLVLNKQSGTQADKIKLTFDYPDNWTIKPINMSRKAKEQFTLVKNGEVTYNTDLSQDQILTLETKP